MRKVFAKLAAATLAVATIGAPASAQFFYRPPDLSGERVLGAAAPTGEVLPDATAEEQRAALVWNMRAGLNIAALQCQFERTLLTQPTYNAILVNHDGELQRAYATLGGYFRRTSKTPKLGQTAFDQYGTRTYSRFSTVGAQYTFCTSASAIGRQMLWTPPGLFHSVAQDRIGELRNSLIPLGEQQFDWRIPKATVYVPNLDAQCWGQTNDLYLARCGAFLPAAAPAQAAAGMAPAVNVARR